MNKFVKHRNDKFMYDVEKSINKIVDKKFKKTKHDLKSIIMSISNQTHNKNIKNFNNFSMGDNFGSSVGQTINSLASAIQKSIMRNL